MEYGTFRISREEIIEHLSSQHVLLSSSVPIFFDDHLDKSIGYTNETLDAKDGIVCHVEEFVFEEYCRGNIEYRFGYRLNIDSAGLKQIELTSINLVPK